MNLHSFDQKIERQIVNRGFQLFHEGAVMSVKQEGQNIIASVQGSKVYRVELTINNQNISWSTCTCPYDDEKYCKHQVAVMFYLVDDDQEQSLENMLYNTSKEGLINLLLSLRETYEDLDSYIRFSLSSHESNEQWARRLVVDSLEEASYGGFIPWNKTFDATNGASYVLKQAERAWEERNVTETVTLTLTVIEELVDYMHEIDDSSGVIGSEIDQAIELLNEATSQAIIYMERQDYTAIIEQVIDTANREEFAEWPTWSLQMLRGVMVYAVIDDIREQIEAMLKTLLSYNYYVEREVILFQYDMKLRLNDPDLDEFLNRYIDFPDMRDRAINKAQDEDDYEKVIELIESADVKYSTWYDTLYKCYGLMGWTDRQKTLAKELLFERGLKYYDHLRKLYSDNEWKQVIDRMIEDESSSFLGTVYPELLLKEEKYEKLLSYCKNNLLTIERYSPYLQDLYPQAVCEIFYVLINKEAESASNRKEYQRVCRTIQEMKKSCGYDPALVIIEQLENQYKRRPAFLDELGQLKV